MVVVTVGEAAQPWERSGRERRAVVTQTRWWLHGVERSVGGADMRRVLELASHRSVATVPRGESASDVVKRGLVAPAPTIRKSRTEFSTSIQRSKVPGS